MNGISIIYVFTTIFVKASYATTCSSRAALPVVTFCQDSSASGTAVAMDGFFVDSMKEHSQCTCMATTDKTQILAIGHIFKDNMTKNCGSGVNFGYEVIVNCTSTGKINLQHNKNTSIILTKTTDSANTKYCFNLTVNRSSINVTCFSNPLTTTVHSAISSSKRSMSITEDTTSGRCSGTTTCTTPVTPLMSTDSTSTKVERRSNDAKNANKNDTIIYIAAGAGGGGFILILILIITCVLCKRHKRTDDEASKTAEYKEEDDELKYNILYISASNVGNNKQNSASANQILSNESSASNVSNANAQRPAKPAIAPKPSSKTFSTDKHVMHIKAPDETNEYAVVHKPIKNRHSTDAVGSKPSNYTKPEKVTYEATNSTYHCHDDTEESIENINTLSGTMQQTDSNRMNVYETNINNTHYAELDLDDENPDSSFRPKQANIAFSTYTEILLPDEM